MAIVRELFRDLTQLLWGELWRGDITFDDIVELLLSCGPLVSSDPNLTSHINRGLRDMQAMSFDGSTQFAETATEVLQPSDVYVDAVWYKEDTTDGVVHSHAGWGMRLYVSGLEIYLNGGTATGVSVNENQWYHTRVRYDSIGRAVELWLDGVSVWTGVADAEYNGSTKKIHIGASWHPFGYTFFNWNGLISSVTITNVSDGTIYAQWDFQNQLDSSGNGRHLTLINNPSFVIDNSAELSLYDRLNNVGYSERMKFSNSQGVQMDNFTALSGDYFLEFQCIPDGSSSAGDFIDRTTGGGTAFAIFNNLLQVYLRFSDFNVIIWNITGACRTSEPHTFRLEVSGSSNTSTLYIDGINQGVRYVSGEMSFSVLGYDPQQPSPFIGVMSDININNQHYYKGHGIEASDWVDQIGDNDGTPSGGGIFIVPAHATDTTKDCLGADLKYSGSAYPALPQKVQSVGRGFNGVNQWVRTGQTIKPTDTEFHASMWIKPNESRTLRIFFSALQSSLYDIKLITGFDNTIVYGVDDGTQDVIETGISTTLNQWIEIYFGTTATEMYFRCPTLNIDLTAPANFDFTSITDGEVAVAARPDGSIGAQCQIAHASINGVSIPFNNSGAYDLASGGSLVNYINNPSVITQDVVHRELEDGFTLYFDTADSNNPIRLLYVNGQPQDDTNAPVSWVKQSEHPAIPNGHNDANTGFNRTHLTEGGNTPPAITATGVDDQNYRFGDSLTNPSFKRVLSPVGEDRHSLFQQPLTGECLEKADKMYPDLPVASLGFPYTFPINLT